MAPDAREESHNRMRMTEPELLLSLQERQIVEKTIDEHCRFREWWLHAVRCLTQHVHVVVTAPEPGPEEVLDQLKAWCTRRLKEDQLTKVERQQRRRKWWTRGGSKRYLYGDEKLEAAVRYVLESQ